MRSTATIATAPSPTSPKRPASPAGGYGMGVAVGDYDGDGFPDLYVTQYGSSILYRNNGDGTFTDVTEKAGVAAPGMGLQRRLVRLRQRRPARSLRLPLRRLRQVARAKTATPAKTPSAATASRTSTSRCPAGCSTTTATARLPTSASQSGIASVLGKAWGVVATDINNDGRMDLFVANDTVANFLFANRGKGRFDEIGLQAGVAYSAEGRPAPAWDVDSADVNEDGWMDLFVANIDHEIYSLYHNNHDETFDDQALATGIGAATRLMSGWGLKFFDYDNDGNLDLIARQRPSRRPDRRTHASPGQLP